MQERVNIAILGSGGDGIITIGELLLSSVAACGYYGVFTRATGPQIRGGEVAVFVRVTKYLVESPARRYHIVFAFDKVSLEQFRSDIVLGKDTVLVYNGKASDLDDNIRLQVGKIIELDLNLWAKEIKSRRKNIIAFGIISNMLNISQDVALEQLNRRFSFMSEGLLIENGNIFRYGCEKSKDYLGLVELSLPQDDLKEDRWILTGSEAIGYGALWGGIRFVSGYPITPATDVLEWLAKHIDKFSGQLFQVEDELASVCTILGASYGGVPSMTVTSGPGLSLMVEAIGLAIAAEIPIVIVNVMRGGPSTGIPTKSEQADLNLAIYGVHGDAPHIVVAPNSIGDCIRTTAWAIELAEYLQTVSIVLSDQALGQTKVILDKPEIPSFKAKRKLFKEKEFKGEKYLRYKIGDDDFISEMSIPGMKNGEYTATGLEHLENGEPSSNSLNHKKQLDKRLKKLTNYDYGSMVLDVIGEKDADYCLICFGSVTLATLDAKKFFEARGNTAKVISIRLLSPLPIDVLKKAIGDSKYIYSIEQTHMKQFYHYLNSFDLFKGEKERFLSAIAYPGASILRGIDIVKIIDEY